MNIQIDLKVIEGASTIARAAGLTEPELGWGLIRMWHYCWATKRDRVTPIQLLGFFGAGDRARLIETLEGFGFLEDDGAGDLRVRGAGRYLRLALSRSKGAAITNAKRWGTKPKSDAPESLPNRSRATRTVAQPVALERRTSDAEGRSFTDHRSPDLESKEDLFAGAPVGAPPAAKPKKERKPSRQERFLTWAQEQRRTKTEAPDQVPDPAVLNTTLGKVLDELGEERARAAYRLRFLADPFAATRSPPYPWGLFVAQARTKYAPPVQPVGDAPGADPAVRVIGPDEDPYA